MKKLSLILVLFSLLAATSNAQFWKLRRIEASAGLGTSQIYSDIGGFSRGENMLGLKDFTFKQTRYNLTLNGRYRILKDVSARINLSHGKFHSTDGRGSNIERKYESVTGFTEFAAIGEFYFVKNQAENSFLSQKGNRTPFNNLLAMIDCYAFTGFGAVLYNVKPNDLLSTKTSQLKGTAPVIPIGVGASFNYSPAINFGAEFGGRYVFSDNLEGYTSEYSDRNDIYYFFTLSFTYKFRTGAKNNPSF